MTQVCDPVALECDACNELSLPADDMNVEADLTPASTLYLFITNKFGNQYRAEVEIGEDGSFDIDPDEFPEGMFNASAGAFDAFLAENSDGTGVASMTFEDVEYNCLKISITCE